MVYNLISEFIIRTWINVKTSLGRWRADDSKTQTEVWMPRERLEEGTVLPRNDRSEGNLKTLYQL